MGRADVIKEIDRRLAICYQASSGWVDQRGPDGDSWATDWLPYCADDPDDLEFVLEARKGYPETLVALRTVLHEHGCRSEACPIAQQIAECLKLNRD